MRSSSPSAGKLSVREIALLPLMGALIFAAKEALYALPNININAVLINDGMPQSERLMKLNQIAIQQMQVLEDNSGRNLLK